MILLSFIVMQAFSNIVGIIILIGVCLFLLFIAYLILSYPLYLLTKAYYAIFGGLHKRRAILKSLAASESNSRKHAHSLYEQYLHLNAGLRFAAYNGYKLRKYENRMTVQLELITGDSQLNDSKTSYFRKYPKVALYTSKIHGENNYNTLTDLAFPRMTLINYPELEFDGDFPDLGDFGLDFNL